MQFVLNCFEKLPGYFRIIFVIDTALLIDIGYFKIQTPFAGADLPDALQQFIKVILAEVFTLFQPFIIQHKTFNNKLFKRFGGPYPALGCLETIYPVTDCDYSIKVIK